MEYAPPVDRLLDYGYSPAGTVQSWPDYVGELGLSQADTPDLIRMMTDDNLHEGDPTKHEIWAPIHAWRTLGELHADDAIEPILGMLEELAGDEWAIEELPQVIGLIGPMVIPTLKNYLGDDKQHNIFGRSVVISSLEKIGKLYPEFRDEAVAVLIQQLEKYPHNEALINAFLISSLIELKAREAGRVIEHAYLSKRVESHVVGDWNETQVSLGLKTTQEIAREARNIAARRLTEAGKPKDYKAIRRLKNKAEHQSRIKNKKRK